MHTGRDVLAVHLDYRIAHEQLPSGVRCLVLVDPARDTRREGLGGDNNKVSSSETHLEMRIGSLCSAPPLMLRPRPPTFWRVTCTIRSLISGAAPVLPLLLLLLFRLFELEDRELRRLGLVAEDVRLLFVGDTADSSSFCRVNSSMDSWRRTVSGRVLPSLTLCGVDGTI